MNCKNCGFQVNENDQFCGHCGTPVENQNVQSNAFMATNQTIQNNSQQNIVSQTPIEPTLSTQQFVNNYSEPINNENNTLQAGLDTNYNVKTPKSKNSKLVLIIIGCILLVALTAIIAFVFIKNKSMDNKIEAVYDEKALIPVIKDDKHGYIDTNGKFVIQPIYDYATPFYENHAIVALITNTEGSQKKEYQVIDKSGNVKATANYSSDIKYIEKYNIWIISGQLYDNSLKKLSSDGITVRYVENGYLEWSDKTAKTAGIMNSSGKITYTYKFTNDENSLYFQPSDNNEILKENYCVVSINSKKYGIVNCDTGNIVYDFTDNRIFDEDNNIFEVSKKDNNTYTLVSLVYIQNDKIVFQTSTKNVYLTDYNIKYGYIEITDTDKEYSEKYSYIDISTGQIVKERPKSSVKVDVDEWEEYTSTTKFSCKSGYGLMSGEKITLPCEWSDIKYLDLDLYKYLSSKGKEYVIAQKANKNYLLSLKDGKSVAEFNTTNIYFTDNSTFISYKDAETNKEVVYNLLTGNSISLESKSYLKVYSNYITIEENNKLNYYNTDLKLIYTK